MAQVLGPGDAFRKSLLAQLYEPVLTSLGNGILVLRGFEREGEVDTVHVAVRGIGTSLEAT